MKSIRCFSLSRYLILALLNVATPNLYAQSAVEIPNCFDEPDSDHTTLLSLQGNYSVRINASDLTKDELIQVMEALYRNMYFRPEFPEVYASRSRLTVVLKPIPGRDSSDIELYRELAEEGIKQIRDLKGVERINCWSPPRPAVSVGN